VPLEPELLLSPPVEFDSPWEILPELPVEGATLSVEVLSGLKPKNESRRINRMAIVV
jgi:hypothetical protein